MGFYDISEKVLKLEGQGRKVAKLYVGEPETETPREVVEAAHKAMLEGKTKYSSGAGIPKLRQKIAQFHGCKPEQVTVGPGVKWFIFSSMKLLAKRGDNVVIQSPYYPPYELNAKSQDLEFRTLKTSVEGKWQVDPAQLEEKIDKRTRIIAIVNPHNPTSTVMQPKVFNEILEIAQRRKVHVLLDEVYKDIAFRKITTGLDARNPLHLTLNGFSKTFSMSGWRVGYCVSSEEIAQEFVKLSNTTVTCVPPFIQEAAVAAMDLREREAKKLREAYGNRAALATRIFSSSKKIKFVRAQSGLTIFLQVTGLDSDKFVMDLLDRKAIGIAPGGSFGMQDCVRVALVQPESELEKNLETIRDELEEA